MLTNGIQVGRVTLTTCPMNAFFTGAVRHDWRVDGNGNFSDLLPNNHLQTNVRTQMVMINDKEVSALQPTLQAFIGEFDVRW